MSKPLLTGGNGKSNDFVGTQTGQLPTWSASAEGGEGGWVLGPGVGGSGGGGEVFYFNFGNTGVTPTGTPLPQSTTSTPSTSPSLLGPTYNPSATSVTSENLPDGSYSLVAGFLSAADSPGVLALPAGLWDFNIWAASTASNNSTQVQIQARVYIANAAGTQYGDASGATNGTPLAVSDAVYLYEQATIAQYILNVTIPQTTITATDRIYIELWAQKNVPQARTVTFSFATNQPSHVHTTIYVPINLATEVTGILPTVNGGTGAGTGSLVNANKVFAGPATGADALPTFRALVAADVAGITPYDLRGNFVGNPATGRVLDTFVADRAFTIGATNTLHKFWADEKTAGDDVVITVQRTRAGVTSTIFTATSASTDTALNGYWPMTISAVANNAIEVNDLVEVVMGTTQAAFSTPVWTIYGTA
jgi:hypothetical protein